jgi:NADPH-dependent 2,4-dienoyl-CoA reductase/sulfur reductase-like enzyme/rhodanese-related sulfurtransferase
MDPRAEITIVQEKPDLSMASCGYPYYIGGTFDDRSELINTPTGVIRDSAFFQAVKGIRALTRTRVIRIDRDACRVSCVDLTSEETFELPYDKLVLATGATPVVPPLPGHDLAGISTLQSMEDADRLRRAVDEHQAQHAVIVGGGLIGVETCEALRESGIQVTLVEMLPQILSFLDWELAKAVENHVVGKGVRVITGNPVASFIGRDGRLSGVVLNDGERIDCQLAVIAVGVRPNSRLAQESGLRVGATGGMSVDAYMQTSDPNIYAVGDCVEIPHRITGRMVHVPYGDLANLQGRIAAQNLVLGNQVTFPGTIQTGVCKVFDFSAGSTGLSEEAARDMGREIIAVLTAAPDKPHYMSGKLLLMKMVAEKDGGRLLGVQAVGPGDASKRLAAAAMAIQGGLTVTDLVNADLPYAPPYSPAIDNLILTAHVLENKMLGRMTGVSGREVLERLSGVSPPVLLDVRSLEEFEAMRLGVGEQLIPLGALRGRLDELPADKEREIICYCKVSLRGYEAATLLEAHGWKNAKVLEGGVMAWPYPREK